jgi:hypothetical protein
VKIIEGMKQIKNLTKKAEDLRAKIKTHSADLSFETPVYPDQRQVVDSWLQSHGDVLKEIMALRFRIQRTNIVTQVAIQLGGKSVTKSISEWIHRRRDLAKLELEAWSLLTDRGLKEQNLQTTKDGPVTEVRIRRYYDPVQRDSKRAELLAEPNTIDAALEIANATTDLVE